MVGLGQKLKDARKAKGLSQQNVADILQIHRTTYTKYETDVVEPSLETVWALMQVLDFSIEEWMQEKE